jgi:hemoglobin-like flavoprotein
MAMLQAAVAGLDRLAATLPAVRQLRRRHAGYGVSDHDYDTVGAALLWTPARGLGAQFTPAVADAWTAACALLATAMRDDARGQAAAPVG